MNQFDALKARVAERRSIYGRRGEVDDDVDAAIAIIETDMIPALERAIDLQVELITGRTQARAAVLALRDELRDLHSNVLHQGLDCDEHCKPMADTEHYEQYRQQA